MRREAAGRLSRRATEVIAASYDDFPLAAGDLDFRGDNAPPLPTAELAVHGLSIGPADLASYGPVAGFTPLRQAVADLIGVDGEQVVITTGASEALNLAFICTTDAGGQIGLPQPAFPGFRQLAELNGLAVVPYDGCDPAAAVQAVRADHPTVICTPHNPSGLVADRDQVLGVRAGWIIWDISHMQIFGQEAEPFQRGLTPSELVVFSLSKLLRLPGARIGCLVAGSRAAIETAVAVKTHLSMSAALHSQRLAEAVLRHPGTPDELRSRAARFGQARWSIQQALGEVPGLRPVAAQAGTHLLCFGSNGAEPWRRLKDAGVVGLPGTVFGGRQAAVRLCVAQPDQVVDAAVERLRALG